MVIQVKGYRYCDFMELPNCKGTCIGKKLVLNIEALKCTHYFPIPVMLQKVRCSHLVNEYDFFDIPEVS